MHYSIVSGGLATGMPENWKGQRVPVPFDARDDYFFVDMSTLKFPDSPFLTGLNLWPGTEWHQDRSRWQGDHDDADSSRPGRVNRAYLWRRQPSEKLVIVDQYLGMRLLEKKQIWELNTPTPQMVAEYLTPIGLSARNVRAADFVLHNLRRLADGVGLDVSNQIARVERRRSEMI